MFGDHRSLQNHQFWGIIPQISDFMKKYLLFFDMNIYFFRISKMLFWEIKKICGKIMYFSRFSKIDTWKYKFLTQYSHSVDWQNDRQSWRWSLNVIANHEIFKIWSWVIVDQGLAKWWWVIVEHEKSIVPYSAYTIHVFTYFGFEWI